MGYTCTVADELVHAIDPNTGSYLTEDGVPCEMFVYFLVAEDDDGKRYRSIGAWDDWAQAEALAEQAQHECDWHNLDPGVSQHWRQWYPAYASPAYMEWQAGGGELAWERSVEQQAVWSKFYRMASW